MGGHSSNFPPNLNVPNPCSVPGPPCGHHRLIYRGNHWINLSEKTSGHFSRLYKERAREREMRERERGRERGKEREKEGATEMRVRYSDRQPNRQASK